MERQIYIGPPLVGELRAVNVVTSNPFTEKRGLVRLDDILIDAHAERVPVMFTSSAPEYGQFLGLFSLLEPSL